MFLPVASGVLFRRGIDLVFGVPPEDMEDARAEESPKAFLVAHAEGEQMIRPFFLFEVAKAQLCFLDDALCSDEMAARSRLNLRP
ncbi:MAG: hypothetical protein WCK77_18930 [Verrucomicrobiota bacterium]